MHENERTSGDGVVRLHEAKQRQVTEPSNEASLRRLALQLAVQLPDDRLQAQAVVAYLAELVNGFIHKD